MLKKKKKLSIVQLEINISTQPPQEMAREASGKHIHLKSFLLKTATGVCSKGRALCGTFY